MEVTVLAQLEQSRALLSTLAEGVERMHGNYPDSFADPEIADRLRKFEQSANEGATRLAHSPRK